MEHETWASEILHEIKEASRRVYYLALALLIGWLITIAGFLWYITLPVDVDTVTLDSSDGGNANYIGNDMSGEIYNGENSGYSQPESSQN